VLSCLNCLICLIFFLNVFHPDFFYCSLLDQILFTKPFFVCQLKTLNHLLPTPLWSSSRIRPWSSILHLIHHPLSTVISYSAANRHLYADDIQLLLSFSALDLSRNTTEFENTITNVFNWMSSKFLSLNPFKVSFSSLVYHNNYLNSIILPLIYLLIS